MKVENLLVLFSQFAPFQCSATLWSMARLADNNMHSTGELMAYLGNDGEKDKL